MALDCSFVKDLSLENNMGWELCFHDKATNISTFYIAVNDTNPNEQNIKILMGLGHWNAPTGSANQEMMTTTTFVTDVMTKIS